MGSDLIQSKNLTELFESIVETRKSAIFVFDNQKQLIYVNPAFKTLTGYSLKEFYKNSSLDYTYDEDRDRMTELRRRATEEKIGFNDVYFRVLTKSGKIKWCVSSWRPIFDKNNNCLRIECRERDIKEEVDRRVGELALEDGENRFKNIADSTPVMMWMADTEGNFTFCNKSWLEFTGHTLREEIGSGWFYNIHSEDSKTWIEIYDNAIKNCQSFKIECRFKRADGEYRWLLNEGAPRFDESQHLLGYVGSTLDITDRKSMEQQLDFDARFDPLTGLANRKYFKGKVQETIELFQRDSKPFFTLLFIDIDRFKIINDSLGHTLGDKLLTNVALRLQDFNLEKGTVCRLGGDEFTIILKGFTDLYENIEMVKKIQNHLTKPYIIDTYTISITISIGVATANQNYENVEDILRDADTAMYIAKQEGKNRFRLFSNSMHTDMVKTRELYEDLQKGIQEKEFYLVYQPIISLKTNQIISCESLLRWKYSQNNVKQPSEFLRVAEDTGSIMELEEMNILAACQNLQKWHTLGYKDLSISVNISKLNLCNPGFVDKIKGFLKLTNLPAKNLQIELTESILIENTSEILKVLKKLNHIGISLYLDDFGTGFSSLAYLKNLPIQGFKIDQSFISDIGKDIGSEKITKAIINLGKDLDLKVIVEGVETQQQLDFLSKNGCDLIQGFLFSKPLDKIKFGKFLKQNYSLKNS
jgi:diguanylate cyclase (GGDEF)-like protein/PAS domain S-box-containing protein